MENNKDKKEKALNALKSVINDMDLEYLHSCLLQAYFDYSQLLTKNEDMFISGSSERLYCFSVVINALDCKSN